MSRVGLTAFVIGLAVALPAASQNYPGQMPDPNSYNGSMELQRREREQSQQVQQQNDAMLQRLDDNYKYYAPGGPGAPRAGGGGGRSSIPPLKSKPLLPAAKNPLLGMWRMGAAKPISLGPMLNTLPGTSDIVNGAMSGGCASVFGKPDTVIRFTPTQFNWVAPDGHDEILNHVEYRSDGANIILIPSDGDIAMILGMPDKDHAVVAFFGCTMSRTNTSARLGQTAAATAGGGGGGGTKAAVTAGQAVLNLIVGQTINGTFSAPPAGTRLTLTTQDPDANLVKAGFAGPQPVESLFAACKINQGGTQARCNQGLAAMMTGAIGATATDPNGHAATGAIPPGRYYIVGFTPYQGHSLIWHLPVDLKPGANTLSLTPQNGSLSH